MTEQENYGYNAVTILMPHHRFELKIDAIKCTSRKNYFLQESKKTVLLCPDSAEGREVISEKKSTPGA
jgi:hypothetical protein